MFGQFVDTCMLLAVVNKLYYQNRRGINKEHIKYCFCLAVALHFMACFE
jgi:hypothetical protein